jgi:hypothetical protein
VNVDVTVQGTATGGNATVDNAGSMYLEYVAPTRIVFSGTATQTTNSTNLNQATAYALEWTEDRTSAGFGHNDGVNPENITANNGGDYLVHVSVPIEAAVQRANIKLKVKVNGVTVDGGEGNQGYIRNSGGHNNASVHWSGTLYNLSVADVITVTVEQEAAAGTVTVSTGYNANISIEQLNTTNDYFYARTQTTTTGTNWNVAGELDWTTNEITDGGVFTLGTSDITVSQDGDYLLIYNGAFTSTAQRANPNIVVELNGVDVDGGECKSNYIRGSSGHNDSSCTMIFYLRALDNGDVIKLRVEPEGVGGTVDDIVDSVFSIWYKG